MEAVESSMVAWQVTKDSNFWWNNVYGIHQYEDNRGNQWELIDHTAGDEIALYLNCHQVVAVSNHVLGNVEDYALLIAGMVDSIIRHEAR